MPWPLPVLGVQGDQFIESSGDRELSASETKLTRDISLKEWQSKWVLILIRHVFPFHFYACLLENKQSTSDFFFLNSCE